MAISASVSFSEKVIRLAQNMELAHAFLWEHNYNRLKLVQLLGQLGGFLTVGALQQPNGSDYDMEKYILYRGCIIEPACSML